PATETKPATEGQSTKPATQEHPTKPVTGGQSEAGSTQPASTTEWTTSTVYTTTVRTVTSCAPEFPNCEKPTPHVTTETVAISTTVCPVTEQHQTEPKPTQPKPTEPKPTEPAKTTGWSTSTIYTTSVRTVTACGPEFPNCETPTPHVTTETIAVSTTICPVTEQHQTEPKPTEPKPTQPKPTEPKPTEPKPTEPAKTTAWSTSTVYTTSVRTVTTCGPDHPNCETPTPHVTTETIAISTTVCPVTEEQSSPTKPSSPGQPSQPSNPEQPSKPAGGNHQTYPAGPVPTQHIVTTGWSTSTVYTTNIRTVTACAPHVANCPGTPHVTTETIALSTTLCPVTKTQVIPGPGATYYPPGPNRPGNSTSTLYTTKYFTVTACPPTVTDCPIGAVTSTVYATATTQIQQWNPSNSHVYQPPSPTKGYPPTIPTHLAPGNQTVTTFIRSTTKLYETPISTPKAAEITTTSKAGYEKPPYPVYF
ncbi:hypothetical protein DER46DRAFT_492137, partial [Fusarium sp. MPI-SDFR-AT-0072]